MNYNISYDILFLVQEVIIDVSWELALVNANKEEIDLFLTQCQIAARKSFYLVRSPKNKATLIDLGYTRADILQEIESLTWKDFSEGPLLSHNYSEDVWIFGKIIKCREVYIKIQLSQYNDPGDLITTLFCISFHFAEYPMNYPYQNNNERIK